MKRMIFIIAAFLSVCPVYLQAHTCAEEIKPGNAPQISRNPFVLTPYRPAERDDAGMQKETNEGSVINMKVKGIMIGSDYAVALIGHRLVKTGDVIGGFTVSEILRSGVTLLNGDRVINIYME